MDLFNLFVSIIGAFSAVAALAGSAVAIYRYKYSPRFAVGILPGEAEMKRRGITGEMLYVRNPIFEARFKTNYLASENVKSSNSNPSVRRTTLEELEKEGLFVIVQNNGGKAVSEYDLVMTFSDPKVQILDVRADTLRITWLYTEPTERVSTEIKPLITRDPIYSKYTSIGLPCCHVALSGDGLLAGDFEMIHLAIQIKEPPPQQFRICFHIDYPELLPRGIDKEQLVVLVPKAI